MRRVVKFPRLNIWMLIRLRHELEEAGEKLERISYQLDEGKIDFGEFETALKQVKHCGYRLETALTKHKSHSGG